MNNIQFEQLLQALPENYKQIAREEKAFCRSRTIENEDELFGLVMSYAVSDLSLRSCAGEVAKAKGQMSDTAVTKRLENSVGWINSLLGEVFRAAVPEIHGALRFLVIDGSTAQEPGAKGITNRLHLAFDLMKMMLAEAKVTTDKEGETLDHYDCLRAGDVVMMDRGYNQPKMLISAIARGIDIILRYNPHGMNLWKREENQLLAVGKLEKQEWMTLLKANKDKAFCTPVFLSHGATAVPCYLHAIPLPEEKAKEARRKARAKGKAKNKSGKAGKDAVYTSGWVLLLTSLPLSVLSTEALSEFYRNRWQVELSIKRLKSIINIDRLRAFKGSKMAELYLYANLLYATLVEKIMRLRFKGKMYLFDKNRKISVWRLTQAIHEQLKAGIAKVFPMVERFNSAMVKSLSERKRKRELQKPPLAVQELITWCQEEGVYYS